VPLIPVVMSTDAIQTPSLWYQCTTLRMKWARSSRRTLKIWNFHFQFAANFTFKGPSPCIHTLPSSLYCYCSNCATFIWIVHPNTKISSNLMQILKSKAVDPTRFICYFARYRSLPNYPHSQSCSLFYVKHCPFRLVWLVCWQNIFHSCYVCKGCIYL